MVETHYRLGQMFKQLAAEKTMTKRAEIIEKIEVTGSLANKDNSILRHARTSADITQIHPCAHGIANALYTAPRRLDRRCPAGRASILASQNVRGGPW